MGTKGHSNFIGEYIFSYYKNFVENKNEMNHL